MVLYIIKIVTRKNDIILSDIYGVSFSYNEAERIALEYYYAVGDTIRKMDEKKLTVYYSEIEMWETGASRDGGKLVGKFIYDDKSKRFDFRGED